MQIQEKQKVLLRGLYLVTDEHHIVSAQGLVDLEAALEGGVRLVQFRYKGFWSAAVVERARSYARCCHAYGARLILNDRWDLVEEVGADGAHIGRKDGDMAQIRAALAGKIMGVSCYDELERGREAAAVGADYIAFGACFVSPTKPEARRVSPEVLRAAVGLGMPVCAIGGITLENVSAILETGVSMVAVITDFWENPPYCDRAVSYMKLF